MKTTTELQLVPIGKLVPYVNNARTHSPEQIMKLRSALREFGFINPVIIDRDYGVIAGHGRILAAREEGITEVPCVFADHLTEAQKKAYPIGNSTQENAIVLDTFGGSGSTMMACQQMNRVCYMMELDEKYASVILRRAVENGIAPEDIFVERSGEMISYSVLVKEVVSEKTEKVCPYKIHGEGFPIR